MAEKAKPGGGFGYDGLEVACWGDHFEVAKAVAPDGAYCKSRHDLLAKHGLKCWAISSHLAGQAVCDEIARRHKSTLPAHVWGDGEPEGVRQRAAEEMTRTAAAAKNLGVKVVNGFTGSSIWGKLYFFPPTGPEDVKAGYDDFAKRWGPILDAFKNAGVKFAARGAPRRDRVRLLHRRGRACRRSATTRVRLQLRSLAPAVAGNRPQQVHRALADRIFHVHMKDVAVHYGQGNNKGGDGMSGVLGSHLAFGDVRRGWDFRSVGRGHVNWEAIIRSLNRIGYAGPLSVEWEDAGMDREHGARESCAFTKRLDFPTSGRAFDAAFER